MNMVGLKVRFGAPLTGLNSQAGSAVAADRYKAAPLCVPQMYVCCFILF
jgi:hypothetical protein